LSCDVCGSVAHLGAGGDKLERCGTAAIIHGQSVSGGQEVPGHWPAHDTNTNEANLFGHGQIIGGALCCRSLSELEQLIGLFVTAVFLAAAARRVGAPYPVFLALGGAVLAFVPAAPSIAIPPELALALFVAPVLLDAAYDASLRDLRDNWAPVTGLVVFAVGLTTLAVAVVVRAFIPSMPWAPALVLGAVVAPPDAVAATAVLRQLRPPHRILTILEGESLLNDATALLIYRLAVGAVAANGFSVGAVAPTFMLAIAGSLVAGPALGWLT
jgi:monovalent cation/hydrogen antiporter